MLKKLQESLGYSERPLEKVNEWRMGLDMVAYFSQDPKFEKVVDEKTGSFAFVNKEDLVAAGFAPKATRNYAWRYKFNSIEQMNDYVENWFVKVQGRKETQKQYRTDRDTKKREEIKNLKVGDVLVNSWGYDQTNVDFYQVIKVGERSFTIRPIASKFDKTQSRSAGSDSVLPDIDNFTGEPKVKTSFSTDYGYLHKWDGSPEHQTAAGWGH